VVKLTMPANAQNRLICIQPQLRRAHLAADPDSAVYR
jgi:hypothetical protein